MDTTRFNLVYEEEFGKLLSRQPSLKVLEDSLKSACQLMVECVEGGGKILTCGNGGSAADAEHIVGELLKSFMAKRPIDDGLKKSLTELFPGEAEEFEKNLQGYIPAISLMGHVSLSTAFGNDVNPDYAVAQQLYSLGNPGDVVICISTSGNSRNIVHAAKIAKAKGIKSIGLTGRGGGVLSELNDVLLNAPADIVYEVQELHLPIYHAFCLVLERYFFPNN